jgi:hypothetical protein
MGNDGGEASFGVKMRPILEAEMQPLKLTVMIIKNINKNVPNWNFS